MTLLRLPAAALLATTALIAGPVGAQQRATVEGMVINIGIVHALEAQHVDAQHGVHRGSHGPGAQHIVVSLGEMASGERVADASVSIEVKDPKGRIEKKALLPLTTAGVPDYSEVFEFGWSGKYSLLVAVTPKGAAKPVTTRFSVNHYIR